jgi:hypothetical protein
MKTASVPTLASYPDILVEVWVPRNFDERKLDAAIRKMKTDIRASAKSTCQPESGSVSKRCSEGKVPRPADTRKQDKTRAHACWIYSQW